MAGRPRVMTAHRREVILQSLRRGKSRYGAAGDAGISYDTLAREIAKNADFCELVKQAEAMATGEAEAVAVPWPPESPADARYWLQRRRRDDWSEQQTVKHQGDSDAPLVFDWGAALRQTNTTDDGDNDGES